MTSVPKPLKYLGPYYLQIKEGYKKIKDVNVKKNYADVVSVLAMSQPEDLNSKIFDCLKYCLLGNAMLRTLSAINISFAFRYNERDRRLGPRIHSTFRS